MCDEVMLGLGYDMSDFVRARLTYATTSLIQPLYSNGMVTDPESTSDTLDGIDVWGDWKGYPKTKGPKAYALLS